MLRAVAVTMTVDGSDGSNANDFSSRTPLTGLSMPSSTSRSGERATTCVSANARYGSGGHTALAARRPGFASWSDHQPLCGPSQTSWPR